MVKSVQTYIHTHTYTETIVSTLLSVNDKLTFALFPVNFTAGTIKMVRQEREKGERKERERTERGRGKEGGGENDHMT